MAKITRVFQRIFGSGAGVDQIAQFGSLFAGSPAFTTNAATVQSLSNWLTGWFAAAIGGNAPAIEDMNAAFFVAFYQLAYLLQEGVPEWDTSTTYFIGSIVNDGAGVLYVSQTDNNQGNAVSDVTNWLRYRSGGAVRTLSGVTTLTPNDSLIKANAGSAGFTITLPPVADCVPGLPINFKKVDSTSNVVTIAAGSGDSIDGASTTTMVVQNEAATLYPDGANSWLVF